jgi:hypothetical protein
MAEVPCGVFATASWVRSAGELYMSSMKVYPGWSFSDRHDIKKDAMTKEKMAVFFMI